jgi:ubiquinone/menaquinone biosynthesis C-methylase UbiE
MSAKPRAAAVVLPRPGNAVHFVHGDACRLPFASAVFDRVLAVECIFHFPSRRQFFPRSPPCPAARR